jgi:hypothetical protein
MVNFFAVALAVRRIGPTDMNTFVESNSGPGKRLNDILFGTGNKTALVGILDAEDEFPAVLAGKQVIV